MHKTARTISDYMTPMPFTVESDESLVKARALMLEFNIRHLPVRSDFKIVGVLSLAGVEFMASHFPEAFPRKIVQDALVKSPYIVSADTPLEQVSSHMAKHKVDCALVVQGNGALVGIFTEIDALRALTKICQSLESRVA
jgi:acetoin utilization protein AcuB